MGSWGMFFAPGKTPVGIVERLNTAIRESLQVPEVASIMQRDGYFPDNRNANATAEFFRSELKRMKDAVIAAKIDPV
jgi:tripartite-type tricarboxylate transporter receptor subunit TctC